MHIQESYILLICVDSCFQCYHQVKSYTRTTYWKRSDVASDVGVNLCNVKSCLNTSNNEIFTDKRGDLPCVNISKHTCPVVK